MAELRERASTEGADEMRIQKKLLKTGRDAWTLGQGHRIKSRVNS